MATEVEVKRRRFTLEEYHRMGEAGILHEDDRVELIHGEIVEMTPIGRGHAFTVMMLANAFGRLLGDRAVMSPQNPVVILPDSEPQPDIVLLQGPLDTYRSRLPEPADVVLLVEVADSSVRYDRGVKMRLYAGAGIVEYWIANLDERCLEVYREPHGDDYRQAVRLVPGDDVHPGAFPDVRFSVADILG